MFEYTVIIRWRIQKDLIGMSTTYNYEYRAAHADEWQDAMGLAWRVFLKFVAPGYCEQGVSSFRDFVTDNTLYRMFMTGSYRLYGAFDAGRLIGMITLRGEQHISLLFVDEKYQRQGVGAALIDIAGQFACGKPGEGRLTVNAAPEAVGFYHRVGFLDMDTEQLADGIRYVPMQFFL